MTQYEANAETIEPSGIETEVNICASKPLLRDRFPLKLKWKKRDMKMNHTTPREEGIKAPL